jgi:hypothetical protein
VPTAAGHVQHIVIRHRLQQAYHDFQVVTSGKTLIVYVSISGPAELFPDLVLKFARHFMLLLNRQSIITPVLEKACQEIMSLIIKSIALEVFKASNPTWQDESGDHQEFSGLFPKNCRGGRGLCFLVIKPLMC